jgi:uncharacterized protein (TIGR03083 family)
MPLTPPRTPDGKAPRVSGSAAGIAAVKGGLFPAADIPRPALPHAIGMLTDELAATLDLLQHPDAAAWQLPAGRTGDTVRDIVVRMVSESEEVGRNRRLLGRLRRARLLPGAMTSTRRRNAALSTAPAQQLVAELGHWGRKAADAAPWYRRTPASRFRASMPGGTDVDYLFRVVLAREAWLHRADIAEAAGQLPVPGPHGAEVVRQAVRDVAADWTGPPVIVEVTGPAGGRWLAGDGASATAVRADPVSYLRLVTGRPAGHAEACGDPAVTAAFLASRIP